MTDKRNQAGALLNQGIAQMEAGFYDDSIAFFEQAAAADDTYYAPHFQIGLVHKFGERWPEAARAFVKAAYIAGADENLSDERFAAVLWNVGIACSKVGDWPNAERAWRGLGNTIGRREDGSPSIPMGAAFAQRPGMSPALGQRIDPARIQIGDFELEETGLTAGQIVVHDGTRISTVSHDGADLPVFPVL